MLEFMLIDRPILFPNRCAFCINTRGPVLDTMIADPQNRRYYVCESCAKRIARVFGFIEGPRMEELSDAATGIAEAQAEVETRNGWIAERDERIAQLEQELVMRVTQRDDAVDKRVLLESLARSVVDTAQQMAGALAEQLEPSADETVAQRGGQDLVDHVSELVRRAYAELPPGEGPATITFDGDSWLGERGEAMYWRPADLSEPWDRLPEPATATEVSLREEAKEQVGVGVLDGLPTDPATGIAAIDTLERVGDEWVCVIDGATYVRPRDFSGPWEPAAEPAPLMAALEYSGPPLTRETPNFGAAAASTDGLPPGTEGTAIDSLEFDSNRDRWMADVGGVTYERPGDLSAPWRPAVSGPRSVWARPVGAEKTGTLEEALVVDPELESAAHRGIWARPREEDDDGAETRELEADPGADSRDRGEDGGALPADSGAAATADPSAGPAEPAELEPDLRDAAGLAEGPDGGESS